MSWFDRKFSINHGRPFAWSTFRFLLVQNWPLRINERHLLLAQFLTSANVSTSWSLWKWTSVNLYKYEWFPFLPHASCIFYQRGTIFSLHIFTTCRELLLVWCHFMKIFELLKTLKVIFEVNYPLIWIQIFIFCTHLNWLTHSLSRSKPVRKQIPDLQSGFGDKPLQT